MTARLAACPSVTAHSSRCPAPSAWAFMTGKTCATQGMCLGVKR